MRPVAISIALLLSTADPSGFAITPAGAQERVRTVEVTGLGKDARSALQNAAENALTQVSGTFVRNDTTVERTSEIRGAIRSETRRIDTKMSEYAQGTISSIQVLSTSQEGATTRVEARVSVRLSELKSFIESIDIGTAPIGAEVSINSSLYQRRTTSAEDIVLDTIIRPIVTGTALRFEIGKPFSVKDAPSNIDLPYQIEMLPARYVAIPIKATLDKAHLANSLQALSKISRRISCTEFFLIQNKTLRIVIEDNRRSGGSACFHFDDMELTADDEKHWDNALNRYVKKSSLRSSVRKAIFFGGYSGSGNDLFDFFRNRIKLNLKFKTNISNDPVEFKFNNCAGVWDRDGVKPIGIHQSGHTDGFVDRKCFIPIFEGSPTMLLSSSTFYILVDGSKDWFSNVSSVSVYLDEIPEWK